MLYSKSFLIILYANFIFSQFISFFWNSIAFLFKLASWLMTRIPHQQSSGQTIPFLHSMFLLKSQYCITTKICAFIFLWIECLALQKYVLNNQVGITTDSWSPAEISMSFNTSLCLSTVIYCSLSSSKQLCQTFTTLYSLPTHTIVSPLPLQIESESRSVMSDSLQPHGLYSPWDSPAQNTGVGSLSLLQGIFQTQGSNPGLLHCRWILYQLSI